MTGRIKLIAVAIAALAAAPVAAAAQGGVTVDAALAKKGKSLFTSRGCNACHAFGKTLAGPDLVGATERRDQAWMRRWLKETDQMLQSDSIAKALLAEFKGVKMPNLKLSDAEVDALIHYMQQETDKKK